MTGYLYFSLWHNIWLLCEWVLRTKNLFSFHEYCVYQTKKLYNSRFSLAIFISTFWNFIKKWPKIYPAVVLRRECFITIRITVGNCWLKQSTWSVRIPLYLQFRVAFKFLHNISKKDFDAPDSDKTIRIVSRSTSSS